MTEKLIEKEINNGYLLFQTIKIKENNQLYFTKNILNKIWKFLEINCYYYSLIFTKENLLLILVFNRNEQKNRQEILNDFHSRFLNFLTSISERLSYNILSNSLLKNILTLKKLEIKDDVLKIKNTNYIKFYILEELILDTSYSLLYKILCVQSNLELVLTNDNSKKGISIQFRIITRDLKSLKEKEQILFDILKTNHLIKGRLYIPSKNQIKKSPGLLFIGVSRVYLKSKLLLKFLNIFSDGQQFTNKISSVYNWLGFQTENKIPIDLKNKSLDQHSDEKIIKPLPSTDKIVSNLIKSTEHTSLRYHSLIQIDEIPVIKFSNSKIEINFIIPDKKFNQLEAILTKIKGKYNFILDKRYLELLNKKNNILINKI